MPKSQVLEKGLDTVTGTSVVIPFPGITIHFPFFLDAPSDDFFACKSRIRWRFVIHARGKRCPFFISLRSTRRPNDVLGHSIDAIFQRELPHMDRRLTQNCFRIWGGIFCIKQGKCCLFFALLRRKLLLWKIEELTRKSFSGRIFGEELEGKNFGWKNFLWENFW